MAKKGNVASVLAFEKKLVPSDATMEGTTWMNREAQSTPLKLIEKSVKGTISNRLKADIRNDPIKLNAKIENSNLQVVDSCALNKDQDTLKLSFTLKILSGVQNPSACNDQSFNKTLTEAVKDYIKRTNCTELAERYATNIASGRFLWRNRVGAESIEIKVKILNSQEDISWVFNGHDYSLKGFDLNTDKIQPLANKIADTLSGKEDFLLLEIISYTKIGKAQNVYPSEELVLDKGPKKGNKGNKSKILYAVNDIASMHSQKIGNALRSIDTWYPKYDPSIGPIAAEPYGAVTNFGTAFRNPSENADFFTLFDNFSTGKKLNSIEDEHYVMAVLIRGGVFGESDKE